jgi:hypothetical protein
LLCLPPTFPQHWVSLGVRFGQGIVLNYNKLILYLH